MGHVSASLRLAAHQSGRAIAAAASKFDGSPRGVKYVAAVETVRPSERVRTTSLRSEVPMRQGWVSQYFDVHAPPGCSYFESYVVD
ncbi:MAG: hypothetical protein QOH70_1375 [Blastocatellia bacterium]|nr:hypothetical protein [Blastocatellia bacterium]